MRYVTPQKSEYLIYTAVEAWNHSECCVIAVVLDKNVPSEAYVCILCTANGNRGTDIICAFIIYRGRGSVVGTATHYRLDGPGFERRGRKQTFSSTHPFRPSLGPTQPPIKCVAGLFPGSKPTKAWRWPHTSTKSYISTPPLCFLWHFMGVTFIFTFTFII
jgi:hypothetical protein